MFAWTIKDGNASMGEMHDQLRLFGFDEVIKQAKGDSSRSRLVCAAAEILVEPDEDDLTRIIHEGGRRIRRVVGVVQVLERT
jgi:hypothetical protein